MLVLTRKIGEEVVIGDHIRLTLVAIHGRQVRLGVTAPLGVSIRREELGVPGDGPAEPGCPAASVARIVS
jgi:carbon storage regulator